MGKLLNELCNVSINGRKTVEAKEVWSYIKKTTLTSYVDKFHKNLRQIVKSINISSIQKL